MSLFVCGGCKHTYFYVEGLWVKCLNCDRRYSTPSRPELQNMMLNKIIISKEEVETEKTWVELQKPIEYKPLNLTVDKWLNNYSRLATFAVMIRGE